MKKTVDILIVGLGLAGVVLSKKLLDKKKSILVIDHFKANSSSRVAAGIYNPVAYRNLKMAEFASTLLPKVKEFYPAIEKELPEPIFQPQSFLKLLTGIEELNNWNIKSGEEKNYPFMAKEIFKKTFDEGILNPFGAGQVLQSGRVILPKLVNQWRERLIEKELLFENNFKHADLSISNHTFLYQGISAKKIIFTEGVGVVKNPWFNWLPIQQFKGETLKISAPQLKLNRLVNRGVFVLPEGNGIFKIGATHDWRNVNEIPTPEGKMELLEKVDKIINVPYEVIDHQAGLRPASRDRKPMIGAHPEIPNMFVVNGLGSKGVIWSPWLIDHFIDKMETQDWDKLFNIIRYQRFYSNEKN